MSVSTLPLACRVSCMDEEISSSSPFGIDFPVLFCCSVSSAVPYQYSLTHILLCQNPAAASSIPPHGRCSVVIYGRKGNACNAVPRRLLSFQSCRLTDNSQNINHPLITAIGSSFVFTFTKSDSRAIT